MRVPLNHLLLHPASPLPCHYTVSCVSCATPLPRYAVVAERYTILNRAEHTTQTTRNEPNHRPNTMPSTAPPAPAIPSVYRFVFCWLEPVSILTGAIYAHFFQSTYLHLTHAASSPGVSLPISTSIVMSQLANLYLGLAFLEASVLRATPDIKVWKTFLVGLLVADLGHLLTVLPLGTHIYWAFWRWNAIDLGNVPFVYFLAVTRICMLLGVGFQKEGVRSRSKMT